MDIEQIYQLLVAGLPTLTAVVAIITACVKIIKQFGQLRNEVKNTTDIKDVEKQLKVVLNENAELKKSMTKLNNTITKRIDRIFVVEETNEEEKK